MNKLFQICSLVAAITFIVLTQGCATAPKYATVASEDATLDFLPGAIPPDQLAKEPLPPIIDAHTHTEFDGHPERSSNIPMTEKEYLRELKEAGAVGAIAHTHQGRDDYHDLRKYGVLHCAGVASQPNYTEIRNGLFSGKYSCIKIYLGYVHQFASDKRYRPLYKLAEEFDIPVVFHTGDTYSIKGKLKYADPMTVDEVATDYPKVKFVIAHCGNPWIESAAEVAYKNPNVYLDGSAFLIGNLDKLPPEQVETYMIKPLAWIFGYIEDPKKLMFGSDWPLNDIAAYARAFKQAIPKEHWKAVFHDNAMAVFHFDRVRGLPQRLSGIQKKNAK